MRKVYRAVLGVSIVAAIVQALPLWAEETHSTSQNTYQILTGDDPEDDRSHWDQLYNSKGYVFGKEPAAFLKNHVELLKTGRALDIAMGEGRNAVFLAKKGFNVEGVDLSEVAVRKSRLLAKENHVAFTAVVADLNHYTIRPESYDLIININYLQRSLIPQIKRGLKHGGQVVFENWTVEQLKNAPGQHLRRDYLLEKGELKELFKEFEIVKYVENNDGKNAVASLIARKP